MLLAMSSASPGPSAVIPYAHPTAITREEAKEKWALALSLAPGRTLNAVYSTCGRVLETHANRLAHHLRLGPESVSHSITSFFRTKEERLDWLVRIRDEIPPRLKRDCSRMIKYTLPSESPKTQLQAFKRIVAQVTFYPGLRLLFIRSKRLQWRDVPIGPISQEAISGLWDRPNWAPDDEWAFWRTFAATCLSDTSVSAIIEKNSVPDLTKCQDEGLCVIELLIISHDSGFGPASSFSDALCIRYLAGILDLPRFWLEPGSVHSDVARKLCIKMVQVLKDIGVDDIPSTESMKPESPFDYEGVDLLAEKIVAGIIGWFSELELAAWILQPWYPHFREVIQLLRWPRSALLLPGSFTRATSDACETIVQTICQTVELDILVETMTMGSTCPSELVMWDSGPKVDLAVESITGGQVEVDTSELGSPSLNSSVASFKSSSNPGSPSPSSLFDPVPSSKVTLDGASSTVKLQNDGTLEIPVGGSGVVVKDLNNASKTLYVYTSSNFAHRAALEFPAAQTYKHAHSSESAHIGLRSHGPDIIVDRLALTTRLLQETMQKPSSLTNDTSVLQSEEEETRFSMAGLDLPLTVNAIAHFHYHLRHHNGDVLLPGFALEMFRLQGKVPSTTPRGSNMMDGQGVRLLLEEGAQYGFKMRNTLAVDLFPYLFSFDPDTYKISCWYSPENKNDRGPLRAASSLAVGMGSEYPFKFVPGPHGDTSSVFLKLFVSTEYLDLTSMEQKISPLKPEFKGVGRANMERDYSAHKSEWNAVTVLITIRK
ncbi:hypothetical protein DFH07DRAFT_808170 [Mycena maculata]|uniref:Uncharacterized protein n=1 Tax=Mycena maculata TaxID=230809 RepID=A0AAD7NN03_9AGAR|nr:hypothetical protein DFH07DRAFT_808170 [Mycena maculata]